MDILNEQGIDRDIVREDLKKSLQDSKAVYFQRMAGLTTAWSATTRCVKCGDWWMWGIRDNLNFICSKCKN